MSGGGSATRYRGSVILSGVFASCKRPATWWGLRDAFPGGCQVPGWSSAVAAGLVSHTVWSLAIEASER